MPAPRSIFRSRVVIIGSGGRLGSELVRRYADRHDVIPLGREQLDLGNPERIREVLGELEFDRLVLTAALTAVDYCEENEAEAFLLNADAPETIAGVCAAKGAHMTHFSTDFVFDGAKKGAYVESDPVNPVSVYGASKLEGERRVLEISGRNLVVRVAWLFGSNRPAFPEWIMGQASSRDDVSLPADKIGSPTSASDVAELLEPLVFVETPAAGVVHLANSGACTWQEWGAHCLEAVAAHGRPLRTTRVGATTLDSIAAFKAKRPPNSALATDRFTRLTGIVPPPWQDAVDRHLVSTLAAEATAVA